MTNEAQCSQLLILLDKLQHTLISAKLWSEQTPDIHRLQSCQPFCCDTLSLEQWLQFIFIERLRLMAKNNQPLPKAIAVTPMAENAFKQPVQFILLDIIADIDELLSENPVKRSWRV